MSETKKEAKRTENDAGKAAAVSTSASSTTSSTTVSPAVEKKTPQTSPAEWSLGDRQRHLNALHIPFVNLSNLGNYSGNLTQTYKWRYSASVFHLTVSVRGAKDDYRRLTLHPGPNGPSIHSNDFPDSQVDEIIRVLDKFHWDMD